MSTGKDSIGIDFSVIGLADSTKQSRLNLMFALLRVQAEINKRISVAVEELYIANG